MIKVTKKYASLLVFMAVMSISCGEGKTQYDAAYPVKGHPAYENQAVLPYTQAIVSDPDHAEHFLKRAFALMNINCDTLAIIDLKRAVSLDSNNARYQVILGEILNDNQLPHQAVPYFKNAISRDPQTPAYLGLLKSYILMRKYDLASDLINMLNEHIPQHPDLRFLEYELLLAQEKDTPAVLKDMKAFLDRYPEALNIKMLQAETELQYNDVNAVNSFNELFLADTMDSYPLEKAGDYFRQNKDFDHAMTYYRKAVNADLNYYYGFYKIAELYKEYDSLDKALRHYDLARQINPAYAPAYKGMAEIFRMQGQEDSFDVYKKLALGLDPKLDF